MTHNTAVCTQRIPAQTVKVVGSTTPSPNSATTVGAAAPQKQGVHSISLRG